MKFENEKEEKLWVKLLVEGVKFQDGPIYYNSFIERIDELILNYRDRREKNYKDGYYDSTQY